MKRFWSVVFLVVAAVCFALFWVTDLVGGAVGRCLLRDALEDFFRGDCPKKNYASGRFVRSLPYPFNYFGINFTISERLSGLRLGVRVNPYSLEDKDGKLTYIEEGVRALKVEVEDKTMWIMQDPEHSTMTVRQPFYNVNLLTALLAPMLVDAMPESKVKAGIPVPPVSFENKSIIDRVKTAWNVTDAIKKAFNYTEETNSLREIHGFLSVGGDAALAYRNSHFEVSKRQISPKSKDLWSIGPLLPGRTHAYIPGWKNVTFEYWQSSDSGVKGLPVDKYTAEDIWEPRILCQLTNRAPLNMYKKLEQYRVHVTSPGKIQNVTFDVIPTPSPYSVILDVYRPFAAPIGGRVAAQMNYLIPYNASFGKLQGELTLLMLVEMEVEELPHDMTKWLYIGSIVRTTLLILLMVLSCFFFMVGVILLVVAMCDRRRHVSGRRQQRSSKTHDLERTPL